MNPSTMIILALVAALGLTLYALQGERADNRRLADQLADTQRSVTTLRTTLETERAQAEAVATLDRQHRAQLREAENEIHSLRAAVADGTRRLSVHATCPEPKRLPEADPAPRVDDGAGPQLTDDARQAYFDLRAGIAQVTEQLRACQSYVRSLHALPLQASEVAAWHW